MKVSLPWLQNFFEKPLPPAEAAEEALTFHAFEIEEREGDVLDVNVLPDRAGYALCHRGVAAELAAILAVPMKDDPLRAPLPLWPKTHALTVQREDSTACPRYIGALVRGVKVGPSPAWLKEALESVGQRSINAIVDATNYVMLNVGQPLHAFDAGKIAQENGTYKIAVRGAREGEHITTLADSTLTLPRGTLLIADGVSGAPLGIAGVKGGSMAAVDDHTTDLIIEAASFDGPTVRRAAQQLKLFTDASLRFQNKPSPELAAYGMRDVLALITSLAGGEVEGVIDVSAPLPTRTPISLSLEKVNAVLGTSFSQEKVEDIFMRLGLSVSYKDGMFVVEPPFERTDLVIPEDLIEEVGRIGGYDAIEPVPLPASPFPPDQARFRGIERIRDFLVDKGFTEISTQAFAKKGDITLANPFDKTKPALRTSLRENGEEVLRRAKQYAPRVLSPHQEPRLFEIGNIFPSSGERLAIETSEPVADLPALVEDNSYVPRRYTLSPYRPFSSYPFVLRDIAVWVPAYTTPDSVASVIRESAGDLLVHLGQFDSYAQDDRVSYAYRLVFEAPDHTLTDREVNGYMEKVTQALNAQKGYEVR